VTIKEARGMFLGFGQYGGMKLGEIVKLQDGRAYLSRVENWEALLPETREAIALVLKEKEDEQVPK
jgi:hypothetical protein